jgi:hypothetical protein
MLVVEVGHRADRVRRNRVNNSNRFVFGLMFAVAIVVLLSSWPAFAQNPGDNAVYKSSTALTGSPAFIDANALANGDICNTINVILTGSSFPSTGAVIDARGFLPSGTMGVKGSQPCMSDPFLGVTKPSTVLLPASTLLLSTAWVLPNNTRIVGEGENTALQNAGVTGDMIDMGSAAICTSPCSGISVEHLKVDGQSFAVSGIVNNFAQESSYVNDVNLVNILTTGISVGPGANGSGPYSNVYYDCNDSMKCPLPTNTSPSPACVSIQATTRGLHGITCVASSTVAQIQPHAAILLDASNNSIENVHIEGFYDGVLIGSRGSAQGNVLLNVFGGFGVGPVTNTVHICNPLNATGNCTASQSGSVTDLVLLQIESVGGKSQGSFPSAAILDDVTSTEPTNYVPTNAYVGMYVVGNKGGQSPGYSRFTVAPGLNFYPTAAVGAPTLAIGIVAPNPNGTTPCTTPGTIYSNVQGTRTSNNTVFVCKNAVWKPFTM